MNRYFNANDGDAAYFVCARDLDHAKQILVDAGVELRAPDGNTYPVDHPDVSHPTMWMEIDEQRASNLRLFGHAKRLSTFVLGEWHKVEAR